MTRLRFLLVSFFAAVGIPAAARSAEHPDSICLERAPRHWRIDHVDLESLAEAYRKADWGWGCPAIAPTASRLAEAIEELRGHSRKWGGASSGGLAIHGGSLFAHERIYFRLPERLVRGEYQTKWCAP